MNLTLKDKIWNRAAMDAGGLAPGDGDLALTDLLLLHGMIMNGGIDHALDVLSKEDYFKAMSGYKYFQFSDVVILLEKAKHASEDELEIINEEYGDIIKDDEDLVRAFELTFDVSPDKFSPLVE